MPEISNSRVTFSLTSTPPVARTAFRLTPVLAVDDGRAFQADAVRC
jgi:hypothetical protein